MCWRRIEKAKRTETLKNEEVLQRRNFLLRIEGHMDRIYRTWKMNAVVSGLEGRNKKILGDEQ